MTPNLLPHRRFAGRRVVVCAGDSLTAGVMSAPWVDALAQSLGGEFQVVNAGHNGEVAWTLLQRLDEVIACQPDVVCVLIGTNDVGTHLHGHWLSDYVRDLNLPRAPSADWYREVLTRIVQRLKSETGARVAVMTLPPIGADLDPSINSRVGEYNDVVGEVTDRTDATVLDVNERLTSALPASACLQADGLHLTDRAGAIVHALVDEFVRSGQPTRG